MFDFIYETAITWRNLSSQFSYDIAIMELSLAGLDLLSVTIDAFINDRNIVFVEIDLLFRDVLLYPLSRKLVILGCLFGLLELSPELVNAILLPPHLGT